jgi:hypothetical protein
MPERSLREVVAQLDTVPAGDRYEPGPTIFAVRPWSPRSESVIISEEAEDGVAPSRPEFAYLVEVAIAREVLDVWSAWRNGRLPTADEAVDAVLHYAINDSYLPTA